MTRTRIPELRRQRHPLGRHINHDPRSLRYLVDPAVAPKSVSWQRRVPVFDQGNVGSCTGNAMAGLLGTDPFYSTLPTGMVVDEELAVSLYAEATILDAFDGTYPPTDTGSDGLSVAKVASTRGLVNGYRHITSMEQAHGAIQSGPFIVGSYWYEGMDKPDSVGVVQLSGQVRGGHEYLCYGYDLATDRWLFWNSWGPGWGLGGRFAASSATFARLLESYGDATVPVPLSSPAPEPTPVPESAKTKVLLDAADFAVLEGWASLRHARTNRSAAQAWLRREIG